VGFFTHSTKPSDDLLEHGIHGTATVVKAQMAGGTVEYSGYMSDKKFEELLSGERSMMQYKLELDVELPGRAPYTAKVKLAVPHPRVQYMSGGSVVPVLVDPRKSDHLAIDWDGEFKHGSLADMAASDPRIAAALRGAGVDAQKISEQQVAGARMMAASAPPPDPIEQLERLARLRDSGALTEEEFQAQKARLLGE
jgi:hypothetical protein